MIMFYLKQVNIEMETWVVEVVSGVLWVDELGNMSA